jgi:hypothetical protein
MKFSKQSMFKYCEIWGSYIGPWRWKQYILWKCLCISAKCNCFASQKTVILMYKHYFFPCTLHVQSTLSLRDKYELWSFLFCNFRHLQIFVNACVKDISGMSLKPYQNIQMNLQRCILPTCANDATMNVAVILLVSDHPSLLELLKFVMIIFCGHRHAYIFITATTHWLANPTLQDLLWEVYTYSFACIIESVTLFTKLCYFAVFWPTSVQFTTSQSVFYVSLSDLQKYVFLWGRISQAIFTKWNGMPSVNIMPIRLWPNNST